MKNKYLRLVVVLSALLLSVSSLWAERVSQEDAALVAANFMNGGDSTQAAQAPGRNRPIRRVALAEDAQYYVYANADGNGWVMVAANDVATPIIAYSETGTFNADDQPVNLKSWLKGYNKQIKYAEDNGLEATEATKAEWKALRRGVRKAKAAVVVAPLIKTGWDQDSPYWNLCPSKNGQRCYTGCVATAMAQVMNYHQWPKKGTGSSSVTFNGQTYSADFGNTTYDWDNMKNTYTSSTSAQKTAVATLMYHCGVGAGMSYGTDGSGAYTINWNDDDEVCAQNALWKYFGYKKSELKGYYRDGYTGYYSKWTEANWIQMLKDELDAGRPIMYAGGDSKGESGHSFVCDGYNSENKFHFNWGWSNSCDGYYSVNSLVPSETGSGGGNGDYSYEQDVIIGIVPDKKDLPKYNVTWSVKGVTTVVEFTEGDALVLPSTPADCEGANGKKFVGWTAHNTVSGSEPDDLFTTAGSKTVTGNITYYAVFATATTTPAPRRAKMAESTATYTFSNKSWNASPSNWTSGKDGAGYNNSGVQVTTGASGANATCPNSYSNITGITVSYCTNANAGVGSIKMGVGSTEVTQNVTKTGGTTARNLTFDFSSTKPSGNPKITVTCTTNSIYVCGVTITYGDGGGSGGTTTYSAYSLTCDPPCTSTPTMSFINEEVTMTVNEATYTQAVTISGKGSGQTVTYDSSDKTIATVNNSGVVTLKGKVGQTVITASVEASGTYCSNSAEYTITVTAAPINVTLNYNGTSATLSNQPNPYTLPTSGEYVVNMCGGDWAFAGWYGSAYAKNTTKPTYITQMTSTGSAYAVYANTESSGGGSSTESLTFSDRYSSDTEVDATKITIGTHSAVTFTKRTGGTATKYYASGSSIRWYGGGTCVVESDAGNITEIIFTFGTSDGSNSISSDVGTYNAGTWTGNASSVTFTQGGTSGHRRIAGITVKIGGGSSTTYYATSPDCTPVTTYTVTYMSCGEEFTTQTYAEGAALALPTTVPSDNAGKSFAGWIASPSYTNKTTAPTYVTAGGAVNADVTYYAVFH